MDILTFCYFTLYVITMMLVFFTSFIMLYPTTKKIFKAPVPMIHDTIGKVLMPWGMTYVIFLPVLYMQFNGMDCYEYAYNVISFVTMLVCLSAQSWTFTAFMQQRVKQRVLQPLVLMVPTVLTMWYVVAPQEWLMQVFAVVCIVELVLLMIYYVKLYHDFARDLKANYSNVSTKLENGMKTMCVGATLLLLVFMACVVYNNTVWDIINMFTNLFVVCVYIYVSENLVPLPENADENEVEEQQVDHTFEENISKALEEKCVNTLLFCAPELSLQDLAIALGTNRTYLSRWFMMNDTTFYSYINGLRVEYAGHLLQETDKTITQVMTESGFVSKTTFRKYFQNHFGCLPTEYKTSKHGA